MGVIIEIIGVIVLLYFLLHALSFVIKYRIFFYGFIGWILYYHSHFFFLFLSSIIIIIVEYLFSSPLTTKGKNFEKGYNRFIGSQRANKTKRQQREGFLAAKNNYMKRQNKQDKVVDNHHNK